MKKESIILLGHGSRRGDANNILKSIVEIIRPKLSEINIEYAFLEFAEPNINDLIGKMAEDNYDLLYVIPYFLYSGNHVSRDIPKLLDEYREKYPHVDIKMGEHLGIDERLAELVLEKIDAIKLG